MRVTVWVTSIGDTVTLSKNIKIDSTFDITRLAIIRNFIKDFLMKSDTFIPGNKYVVSVEEDGYDYNVCFSNEMVFVKAPIKELLSDVMNEFETGYEYMYENRVAQNKYFVRPRNTFFALSTIFTRETLETIGEYFDKDHATVIHAQHFLYKALYSKDYEITNTVQNIGNKYGCPVLIYNILKEKYFKFYKRKNE